MFQGWSKSNKPQAKVFTTVPRAIWHQGVVSSTVSSGNLKVPEVLKLYPGMQGSAGMDRILLYLVMRIISRERIEEKYVRGIVRRGVRRK